jgi:epoxide hydrolase
VVIASTPGVGFSGPTAEPGWDSYRIATAYAELMGRLGYERFGAQGGTSGPSSRPTSAVRLPIAWWVCT